MKANTALTESKFNKLVDDKANSYIDAFQEGLHSAEDIKAYWTDYKGKLGSRINVLINKNTEENLSPLIALSLSANQPDFNYYNTIKDYFSDKSVTEFNKLIKPCVEYISILFAIDEINISFREYLVTELHTIDEREINILAIYDGLSKRWTEFDRDFIAQDVRNALVSSLQDEVPISVPASYVDYYHQLSAIADNPDNFPIPRFYVKSINHKNKNLCFIVSLDEMQNVIPKSSPYFDVLFALQFYIVDIMSVDDFLTYQMDLNFDGDIDNYKWFLETIALKYDFLKGKHEEIIRRFVTRTSEFAKTPKNEHANKAQRVFALKFLLETVAELSGDANDINDTLTAKFADFIMEGRKADKVKNTYAYRVISKFHNKDKQIKLADLHSIVKLYQDMSINLAPVIKKIEDKISIEKSRK